MVKDGEISCVIGDFVEFCAIRLTQEVSRSV